MRGDTKQATVLMWGHTDWSRYTLVRDPHKIRWGMIVSVLNTSHSEVYTLLIWKSIPTFSILEKSICLIWKPHCWLRFYWSMILCYSRFMQFTSNVTRSYYVSIPTSSVTRKTFSKSPELVARSKWSTLRSTTMGAIHLLIHLELFLMVLISTILHHITETASLRGRRRKRWSSCRTWSQYNAVEYLCVCL